MKGDSNRAYLSLVSCTFNLFPCYALPIIAQVTVVIIRLIKIPAYPPFYHVIAEGEDGS